MLPSSPPFILVIESSPTLQKIIHVTLRRFSFPVRWVLYENTLTALRDIHAGTVPVPDIALIRLELSGLDGIGAMRILQARGYATKVVLLVEQGRLVARLKGRLAGAHAVLMKPFKVQDLEVMLTSFLIRPERRMFSTRKGPSRW
jgi:DNA-binding response OmpR family regulator